MIYKNFVRCAILEDSRNKFGETNVTNELPEALKAFYEECKPCDVEVTYPELGSVRFYPSNELADLQKDYSLAPGCFVFATCNGDPIFLHNNKVYTSLAEEYRPEVLSESFDGFLNLYLSNN